MKVAVDSIKIIPKNLPCLMVNEYDPSTIVLCTKINTNNKSFEGVILHYKDFILKPGHFDDHFDLDLFRIFEGEITLKNG